jgi:hypothetical protein
MRSQTTWISELSGKVQSAVNTVAEVGTLLGQYACAPLDGLGDAELEAILALRRCLGLRDFAEAEGGLRIASEQLPGAAHELRVFLKRAEEALQSAAREGRCGLLPNPGISEICLLRPDQGDFKRIVGFMFNFWNPSLVALVPVVLTPEDSPWKRIGIPADGTAVVRVNPPAKEKPGGILSAPADIPAWLHHSFVFHAPEDVAFSAETVAWYLAERRRQEKERAEEGQRQRNRQAAMLEQAASTPRPPLDPGDIFAQFKDAFPAPMRSGRS